MGTKTDQPNLKPHAVVEKLTSELTQAKEALRSETELRKEAARLTRAILSIQTSIHSAPNFDEVMQTVISEAAAALGSETGAISLPRNGSWVVSHVHGFPKSVVGMEMNDEAEPHAVHAIHAGEIVAVNDAWDDPRVNRRHMINRNVRSVLVVPVMSGQKAIGVCFFNYGTPFLFNEVHLDFARNLAVSISIALDNARLLENLRNEIIEREEAEARLAVNLRTFTKMHALSIKNVGHHGLEPLLQEIMNATIAIMDARKGTLQLMDGNRLRIVAHYNHTPQFLDFFGSAGNVASVCGEATARGERVIVEDVETSPFLAGTSSLAVLRDAGVRAVQSTPLVSRRGDLLGILTTQYGAPHVPDEHSLRRMDMLARLASDMIEHAFAEDALRKSEENYHALFNNMNEVMAIAELLYDEHGNPVDWRVLEVNPAFLRQTDRPVNRIIGLRMSEIYDDRAPLPFLGPFEHVVKTGESIRIERYFAPRRIHLLISAFHLGGSVFGAIMTDITEFKRAEQELRESNRRQREMLEAMPHLVWTCHPDGRADYMGRQWLQFTGSTEADRLDHAWLDHLHPEDVPVVTAIWEEALRNEQACAMEFRIRGHDGSYRWFSTNAVPIRDQKGKLEKWLTSNTDIEDRKQAEAALRKAHYELELRVQERTTELQSAYDSLQLETMERRRLEEQLRQSQKMEALGTLTGGIAHDFNNILAAILGFAEMSLDEVAEGSLLAKNLRYIVKSSFRARDLIRQLLTFSRKTEYKITPLRLTPVIDETVKLLRASIPTTVRLDLKSSAKTDIVFANATGIQQIIMNLVTNGAYAMREKGGTLSIAVADAVIKSGTRHDNPAPGEYVRLTVKDTGIGMDTELTKRIFEPFFTTKKRGEGTGMGLAVAYGIVKSLKGDISVKSIPGIGSTFRVLIPKAAESEEPKVSTAGPIANGKEHILFVDDEETLTAFAKASLERLGYKVTAMTDSMKALGMFSEDPAQFNLVITDQTMPQLTGLHLAEELLKIRGDLPIILCTGYSESVNKEKATAAGIKEFLMKPLARRELGKAVRRALDGKTEP
ncbi:MAG TPA: GAF domain-containing protein [Syntrophorhabdaceae bacterium]